MRAKLLQMLLKFWKQDCVSCGQFAPGKMMQDGVCLFCIDAKEELYDEVNWA